MTDNTYRTSRRDAGTSGGQQFEDPLAELARLIGQTPPANAPQPQAPQPYPQQYEAPPLDAREADAQWANDPRYAQQYDERQGHHADNQQYDDGQRQYSDSQDPYRDGQDQYQDQYRDGQYDDRQYAERQDSGYDAPRLADPNPPPYRTAPPSYDEQPDQYAAPADRDDTRGYVEPPRYDDAHDPIQDVPAFLPRMRDGRYAQDQGQGHELDRGQRYAQDDYAQCDAQGYDEQSAQDYAQQGHEGYAQNYAQETDPDDQSYALEDYEDDIEDEAPAPRRRGFALVAGLLGLVVLCTAGWFGYRAMFGGSIVPSLPPIIKADGSPNKIIPAGNTVNASGQASAGSGSADKLVSREEKPVDVPAPANTPRVVSTIPVAPDSSNPGLPPGMPGSQGMPSAVASGFPAAGAPMQLGPTGTAPAYGGPAAMPAAPQSAGAPTSPIQSPPVAGSANAKKIHTVAVHNGQIDNSDAAQAAPATPAPASQARPQSVARPAAAPAPSRAGANAPLSIVPGGGADTAAPPRTRTAAVPRQATDPAPAAGPPASGAYYVQVSSQRSEAEAHSAYRDLQAKFPSQLGGKAPAVRQVNLGDKGTFYRTLVGPYASTEQAAQMCASLKAAGGSCIVQRN
jgi:hypothetical protein